MDRRSDCLAVRSLAIWTAVYLLTALMDAPACAESLDELIHNVHANEELLKDIEVVVHSEYRLLDRPRREPNLANHYETDIRTVFQREYLYFRTEERSQSVEGKDFHSLDYRGYDGDRTRLVQGRSVCNDVLGRLEDNREWRVHTALIRPFMARGPLSGLLAGAKAGDYQLRATVMGDEALNGDDCVKIKLDSWDPENAGLEKDPDFRWIWISRKYNYIPVKSLAFGVGYSHTIPIEEQVHADFREIAPGIWFPFRAVKTVFDELSASEGKQIVSNREVNTITKVQLDPQYDIALFRDIPFPDGMPVHELKNGEITNSYIAGYPETSGWSLPRGVILSVTILAALATLLLAVRRFRIQQRPVVGGGRG